MHLACMGTLGCITGIRTWQVTGLRQPDATRVSWAHPREPHGPQGPMDHEPYGLPPPMGSPLGANAGLEGP